MLDVLLLSCLPVPGWHLDLVWVWSALSKLVTLSWICPRVVVCWCGQWVFTRTKIYLLKLATHSYSYSNSYSKVLRCGWNLHTITALASTNSTKNIMLTPTTVWPTEVRIGQHVRKMGYPITFSLINAQTRVKKQNNPQSIRIMHTKKFGSFESSFDLRSLISIIRKTTKYLRGTP